MTSFLLGPTYSSPFGLAQNPLIKTIGASLSSTLFETLKQDHGDFAHLDTDPSSVSITALSSNDGENTPFFDFHFSSPNQNVTAGGTRKVTKDSIYRIGSISKLFTVYLLLLQLGWTCWDDGVTRYLPELKRAATALDDNTADRVIDFVDWGQVSIGSLASQLSGIGRDYANGDLASQGDLWKLLGLPEIPSDDVPRCAGNSSLPPCSRKEFFQYFLKRHPVFKPQTTPVYSNAAYRILGYVLETSSHKSFDKNMQLSALIPLGLAKTSAKRPDLPGSFVIPTGESGWFQDVGDETPTAGMFSSSSDLVKFGRAILTHKQLSALDTRQWMKPHSHTARLSLSVGSPWEIWRTKSRISDGRVIDLYTKSGSIGAYNSLLVLIPDYNVSISILAAGSTSSSAIDIATEVALQTLIPAIDKVFLDQACNSICGTYTGFSVGHNSSITVAADQYGLVIQSWISRGVDFCAMTREYSRMTGGGNLTAIRLQTTNVESPSSMDLGENGVRKVAYRAIFETKPIADGISRQRPRIFDPTAHQWSSVDNAMYGSIAVDDFLVHLNRNGSAVAIEPRAGRETLYLNKP